MTQTPQPNPSCGPQDCAAQVRLDRGNKAFQVRAKFGNVRTGPHNRNFGPLQGPTSLSLPPYSPRDSIENP